MSRSLSRSKGYQISPTRLRLYMDQCKRRWAFAAIFGQKEPTTDAMSFGTRVHKVAEDWFAAGVAPDTNTREGKLFSSGLHLLPTPAPNLIAELPVTLPEVDGFKMPGTADLVDTDRGILYDWKTSSAARWIPTVDDLREDTQVNCYGLATMNALQLDQLECKWVYFMKDGSPAQVREFTLYREAAQAHWDQWVPMIEEMIQAHRVGPKDSITPFDFAPNGEKNEPYSACNAYNRKCTFYDDCAINKLKEKEMPGKTSKFNLRKVVTEPIDAPATPQPPAPIAAPVLPIVAKPDVQPEIITPEPSKNTGVEGGPGALFNQLQKMKEAAGPVQVNAPEGANPNPTVPAKKKKTRKKVAKQKTAAEVSDSAAPGAVGMVVLVNCMQESGNWPRHIPLRELTQTQQAMADAAAAEDVIDWQLIDFGKGPARLAHHFQQTMMENPFHGVVYVDRFSPEGKALLTTLSSMATLVLRGV